MKTMAATKAPAARPLSPHLQIYKPTLTMTMSIVHRITGIGNYFGTLLLAWWFIAAASPSSYAKFEWFAGSIIGPTEREWLAAATLIGSIAITVLLWIFGLLAMGGPL